MHWREMLPVAEAIERDLRRAVRQGVLPRARYVVRGGTNWRICTLEIDRRGVQVRADPEIRHQVASIVYKRLDGDVSNVWLTIEDTIEPIRP
jgi:hypothetical protein